MQKNALVKNSCFEKYGKQVTCLFGRYGKCKKKGSNKKEERSKDVGCFSYGLFERKVLKIIPFIGTPTYKKMVSHYRTIIPIITLLYETTVGMYT